MRRFYLPLWLAGLACAGGCLLANGGCTAPTQPIALQALNRGMQNNDTQVLDLSRLAKQAILDKWNQAATTRPASECLEGAINEWEKVSWLQLQHERNRDYFLIDRVYIGSQAGIGDLWYKDLKDSLSEAKASPVEEKPTNE